MSLEKLKISYEKGGAAMRGEIYVLFNPTQLSFSKSVRWTEESAVASAKTSGQAKRLAFDSSEPETLSVSLFFDTYEGRDTGVFGALGSFARGPTSVLSLTRQVAALAQIDVELHRPPVCVLQWGKTSLFRGVLTSLSQQLLLFLPDGTPVRAQLDCTFQQARSETVTTKGELHSADVAKRHTVRAGDTLFRIAAELYGDGALWRLIAEANHIDNPRALIPGQVLAIPKIQ